MQNNRHTANSGFSKSTALTLAIQVTLVSLMLSRAAYAATITVTKLVDSSAPRTCTLRDAISAANSDTAVNGCIAGCGADTIGFSVTGIIALARTLPTILGKLTVKGPPLPGIIIDAATPSFPPFRVMQVATSASLELRNLTIENGDARSSFGGTNGGGIFNDGGKVKLFNVTLKGNTTDGHGGAIFNAGGAMMIENSVITANATFLGFVNDGDGAGIYNDAGRLTVKNSLVSYNRGGAGVGIYNNQGWLNVIKSNLSENQGGIGVAIYNNQGWLSVVKSNLSRNFGLEGADGAGIYNDGGEVYVTNSTFFLNIAAFDGYGGGAAITNAAGSLNVRTSTFSANDGAYGGGIQNSGTAIITDSSFVDNGGYSAGAISNDGRMSVSKCSFSGNAGGHYGGAIINSGPMNITNSTLLANYADDATAIGNGGMLTITNSTFSLNKGPLVDGIPQGGTITNSGSASLKGTILVGGTPAECLPVSGTLVDAGYNISDDNSCGFSAIGSRNNTDARLDPAGLRDNGGATQTIALLMDSPAIDAIPLASCTDQATPVPKRLSTDQRGFGRPDPNNPAACDIGSYEADAVPPVDCRKSAIKLRTSRTGSTKSVSPYLTIDSPRGIMASDLLIAEIAVRGGSHLAITGPPGWTLVRRDNSSTSVTQAIFRHTVLTSTVEPTSYTWRFGNANDAAGGILAYEGAATAAPVEAHSGRGYPSCTRITAPSVTIARGHPSSLLLSFFSVSNSSKIALPAGITQRWSFHAAGGGIGVAGGDVQLGPLEKTGDRTATVRSAGANIGALVVLIPE